MKHTRFLLLLIALTNNAIAQKKPDAQQVVFENKAPQIPDSLTGSTAGISAFITANFKTEKEKVRAIFLWIAENVQYDIDNMFALNYYASGEDRVSKPLKSRKGICENYAALFTEICLKSGIQSFVIEGYTKQNGFTNFTPHAWSAALIDSSWQMFDPTWGSGYINNGKFVKKVNNKFYQVNPSVLIKSHMPFDYLWQFLYYPITHQEFYEGKTIQNRNSSYFNYIDSIKAYEVQSRTEQLNSSAYRIEKNGVKNAMILDRLRMVTQELEADKQNKNINQYNIALVFYNDAVNSYNLFINYRNKQFTPMKPDAEIKKMLDTATASLSISKKELIQIADAQQNLNTLAAQLNKSIEEISAFVKVQEDWLATYFSKSKSKRKSMFYEKKFRWI